MVGQEAEEAPDTLMTHAPAGSEVCKIPLALVTPKVKGFSVVAQPDTFTGYATTVLFDCGSSDLVTVTVSGASFTVDEPVPPGVMTTAAARVPPDAAGSACWHCPAHEVYPSVAGHSEAIVVVALEAALYRKPDGWRFVLASDTLGKLVGSAYPAVVVIVTFSVAAWS